MVCVANEQYNQEENSNRSLTNETYLTRTYLINHTKQNLINKSPKITAINDDP